MRARLRSARSSTAMNGATRSHHQRGTRRTAVRGTTGPGNVPGGGAARLAVSDTLGHRPRTSLGNLPVERCWRVTDSRMRRSARRTASHTSSRPAAAPRTRGCRGVPCTTVSGPSTARMMSASVISSAGRASRYPRPGRGGAHDPGPPQVRHRRTHVVARHVLAFRDEVEGT